jgi:hypothetical protein
MGVTGLSGAFLSDVLFALILAIILIATAIALLAAYYVIDRVVHGLLVCYDVLVIYCRKRKNR